MKTIIITFGMDLFNRFSFSGPDGLVEAYKNEISHHADFIVANYPPGQRFNALTERSGLHLSAWPQEWVALFEAGYKPEFLFEEEELSLALEDIEDLAVQNIYQEISENAYPSQVDQMRALLARLLVLKLQTQDGRLGQAKLAFSTYRWLTRSARVKVEPLPAWMYDSLREEL